MAVFLENVCTFGKCGKTFPTLPHLIIHIEDTHINYDDMIPQNYSEGTHVPLSYILKYQSTANDSIISEIKEETARQTINPQVEGESNNNCIQPQFCFTENECCESESSSESITIDDSEVTVIKKSAKKCLINRDNDKPFACTVPGCKKRYKNINGLKYHLKNGHKNGNQALKQHKCVCGKIFKSLQKLTAHTVACFEKHFIATELTQRTLGPFNDLAFYPENAFYYAANNIGDNVVVQSNEVHLYEVP